jgi:hypothetical protein
MGGKVMIPVDEFNIFGKTQKSFNEALSILRNASIYEISSLLEKIQYYIEHINVLNSQYSGSSKSFELDVKQRYLKSLENNLLAEIERRNASI